MLKNWQEVLEDAFEKLNEELFTGELETPVITLQSSRNTYGHFTVGKVWRAEQAKLNEINISVEHLDRDIKNIMATLVHEMVHYYCQQNNISDTSQNGRYHNKNFKREAEARGLIISKGKSIGWSVTEPGKKLISIIEKYNITKPIDMNRDGETIWFIGKGTEGNGDKDGAGDGGEEQPNKKKTSTRKYICPGCKNSFRATKDINVLCMDCNIQYIKAQ